MDQGNILSALRLIQAGSQDVPEHFLNHLQMLMLIELYPDGWKLTDRGRAVLDSLSGKLL